MHNGSLLEGTVRRTADEIVIQQPGGAIRLRHAEVAHVGRSPLEVYSWLRAQRVGSRGSPEEHLALADWSIDKGLWPQAARELLDARQLAPRSRRLAVLERRFDELTRPRPASKPRQSPGVVTASYEAPVGSTEIAEPNPLPRMPEGAVDFFTRRVQPLLRHGCATAGCHRGGESDTLRLDPSWLHGHADARSTDRNLRATLAVIDLGSPSRSALLKAASGPHYGATPIRGPRREELLSGLEAWVNGIASLNPQDLPPPREAPAVAASETPFAGVVAPIQAEVLAEPALVQAAYTVPAHKLIRGGQVRRAGPRDEFDPAIFNERYRRPEDDLPASASSAPTR